MITTDASRAGTGEHVPQHAIAVLKLRFRPAIHGFAVADSAVVVPRFQQALERYKIDSTSIFAGREAVGGSSIRPLISTSWPTWKFSMS
jgi:hypothetical protein